MKLHRLPSDLPCACESTYAGTAPGSIDQVSCVLPAELPAEGISRLMLSPSVRDHYDIDPACCVGLNFTITKHMALALEGITRLA